ncbi:hypothetical protein DL768_011564 [Monosporascus sp. mg162]|nr:hypothetical protein DL768_011564 [Monosporascus sp. mg162]
MGKCVLNFVYECMRHHVKIPWDNIAHPPINKSPPTNITRFVHKPCETKLRHQASDYLGPCGNIEAWAAWNWLMMRGTGWVDFWNHESTNVGLPDAEPYPPKHFMRLTAEEWKAKRRPNPAANVLTCQLLSTIPRRHRHRGALTAGGDPGADQAGAASLSGSAMDLASSRGNSDSSCKELHLCAIKICSDTDVPHGRLGSVPFRRTQSTQHHRGVLLEGWREYAKGELRREGDTVFQPWERDIRRRTIRPGGDQPDWRSPYVIQQIEFSDIKEVDHAPSKGVPRQIRKAKRFGMIEVNVFRCIESGGAGTTPQASGEQSLELASKPLKGSPSLHTATLDEFQALKHQVDVPSSCHHSCRPAVAPPIIPPSASRYQLEACISQGVLSEHNMIGEFVGRVAQPPLLLPPRSPTANFPITTSTTAAAAPPTTNPPIAAPSSSAEIRKAFLANVRSPVREELQSTAPSVANPLIAAPPVAAAPRGAPRSTMPSSGKAELRKYYYPRPHSMTGLLHILLSHSEPVIRILASIKDLRLVPKHWEKPNADRKPAMRVVRVFAAEKKDKDEKAKKKDDAEKEKGKLEVKNHDEATVIAH